MLKQLQAFAPLFKGKPTQPILNSVLITSNKIYATDLLNWAAADIEINTQKALAPGSGEGLQRLNCEIPYNLLKTILKRKGISFSFSQTDGQWQKCSNEATLCIHTRTTETEGQYSLRGTVGLLPPAPIFEPTIEIPIHSQIIETAALAGKFTDSEAVWEGLRGVYLDFKGKAVVISGSDRAIALSDICPCESEKVAFGVNPQFWEIAQNLDLGASTLKIGREFVTITNGKNTVTARQISDKFPDLLGLERPTSDPFTLKIAPLKKAVHTVSRRPEPGDAVWLRPDFQNFCLVVEGKHGTINVPIQPLGSNSIPLKSTPKLLLKFLKGITAKECQVSFDTVTAPANFVATDDQHRIYIIANALSEEEIGQSHQKQLQSQKVLQQLG